jgi:hypothetical protein
MIRTLLRLSAFIGVYLRTDRFFLNGVVASRINPPRIAQMAHIANG